MSDYTYGMPSIEDQLSECRQWKAWLEEAGFEVHFQYTGETDAPYGFDREWQVWTSPSGTGKQIASFDIDGCGASWHGPDELWLKVIGPKVGVLK